MDNRAKGYLFARLSCNKLSKALFRLDRRFYDPCGKVSLLAIFANLIFAPCFMGLLGCVCAVIFPFPVTEVLNGNEVLPIIGVVVGYVLVIWHGNLLSLNVHGCDIQKEHAMMFEL